MYSKPAVGQSETLVGVEPTSTGLQPVAVPSGSSVVQVSSPGIEPSLRPPQSRVRSGTLQGRVVVQQPAEESNPVLQNRSLPCDPAHSQAVVSRTGDRLIAGSRLLTVIRHGRFACLTNRPAWLPLRREPVHCGRNQGTTARWRSSPTHAESPAPPTAVAPGVVPAPRLP